MKRLEQYDVYELPVQDILYDSSFNCRGAFTAQSVKDLADSIEQSGLQFPVVVQPYQGSHPWRLLAGHRRFRACTLFLKWETIPASVRYDLTEHQARILNLTENLERKDLNMLEEALALRSLYPDGISLRQAARELKRPTRWIHIRRRLLELPESIQKKAAAGLLSAVNLEAILKLESPVEQRKAANAIAKVKAKGKTRHLPHRRKFQARRSKEQISQMIMRLMDLGVEELATRLLAWVAGYVTDKDIEADIEEYAQIHTLNPRPCPLPHKHRRKQSYARANRRITTEKGRSIPGGDQ